MPLITIHTSSKEQTEFIENIANELAQFSCDQLSCGDRTLDPSEMSIRVIESTYARPIGEIELIIMVYSYGERVKKQDDICFAYKKYLVEKSEGKFDFFVWLQLSELGHSVEE